jgi:hypothetical protein
MQDSPETIDPARSAKKRGNYRHAIGVSVVLHILLIGVLLYIYVPVRQPTDETSGATAASNGGSSTGAAPNQPTPNQPTRGLPTPAPSPDIPPQQIEASLESQIREANRLTDERKLSELEKNLSRLQSISTEESVDEVTTVIAGTLGLEPGPLPAETPPEGDLDPDTVQIHDVQRSRNELGKWDYTSILIDAQGRIESVPMKAAEGETVYNTFEQMKRYPVAAGIYRQVVMPMIQKMLQASELAEQAATEAARIQLKDDNAENPTPPGP